MIRYSCIIVCFVLAACSPMQALDNLEVTTPPQSLAGMLAREYQDYARSEMAQYDWEDARHFADKAAQAARGGNPEPDLIKTRNIPDYAISQLTDARQALMDMRANTTARHYPASLARLQLLFDCWLEQVEEQWQEADIAACQAEFNIALTALKHHMKNRIEAETLLDNGSYHTHSLYFGFDSDRLDKHGREQVAAIAAIMQQYPELSLRLSGHTDRSGSNAYNRQLAERRVESVQLSLQRHDIDPGRITVSAPGQQATERPSLTGPTLPAPRQRRVDVELFVN